MKKITTLIALSLLVCSCNYQPPKRAKYTVLRAEMGLGEYTVEVSDAEFVSADNGCITFWWNGQSKASPAGIACGKVWVRTNN